MKQKLNKCLACENEKRMGGTMDAKLHNHPSEAKPVEAKSEDKIVNIQPPMQTKSVDSLHPVEASWEERILAMLDDNRTGLRASSDTNKTRHAILEEVRTLLLAAEKKARVECLEETIAMKYEAHVGPSGVHYGCGPDHEVVSVTALQALKNQSKQ